VLYTARAFGNNAIEIFVNESGKDVLKNKDKLRADGLTDSYELRVFDKTVKRKYGLLAALQIMIYT
jgi:hypothetical protein